LESVAEVELAAVGQTLAAKAAAVQQQSDYYDVPVLDPRASNFFFAVEVGLRRKNRACSHLF